jgi:hypothetical protein
MTSKQYKQAHAQRMERKQFFLKLILTICMQERKRREIYEIINKDYKIALSEHAFKNYIGELLKRRLLRKERDQWDLRFYNYRTIIGRYGTDGLNKTKGM